VRVVVRVSLAVGLVSVCAMLVSRLFPLFNIWAKTFRKMSAGNYEYLLGSFVEMFKCIWVKVRRGVVTRVGLSICMLKPNFRKLRHGLTEHGNWVSAVL